MNKLQKKHPKYTIQSEINVVPFLDILLILLIIFMMIPSQSLQSFEVNLPNSTTTTNIIHDNQSAFTIEIKKTGSYNFIFENQHINDIHLNQLKKELYNIIKIKPEIICLIAADKDIKYDAIIQTLNSINKIGIHSVGMIMNPVHSK